jgi:hypothetical protein
VKRICQRTPPHESALDEFLACGPRIGTCLLAPSEAVLLASPHLRHPAWPLDVLSGARSPLVVAAASFWVVFGDFGGNGDVDVVTVGSQLSVLTNNGFGVLLPAFTTALAATQTSACFLVLPLALARCAACVSSI